MVVGAGLLLLLLPPLFCALFLVAGDTDELLVDVVVIVVPELEAVLDVELDVVVVVVSEVPPLLLDLAFDVSVLDWFAEDPAFRPFSFHVSPSDFPVLPDENSAERFVSVITANES